MPPSWAGGRWDRREEKPHHPGSRSPAASRGRWGLRARTLGQEKCLGHWGWGGEGCVPCRPIPDSDPYLARGDPRVMLGWRGHSANGRSAKGGLVGAGRSPLVTTIVLPLRGGGLGPEILGSGGSHWGGSHWGAHTGVSASSEALSRMACDERAAISPQPRALLMLGLSPFFSQERGVGPQPAGT